MKVALFITLGLIILVVSLCSVIKLLVMVTDRVTEKLAKAYCNKHGYLYIRVEVLPEDYVLHFEAHGHIFLANFNIDKNKNIVWTGANPEKVIANYIENEGLPTPEMFNGVSAQKILKNVG